MLHRTILKGFINYLTKQITFSLIFFSIVCFCQGATIRATTYDETEDLKYILIEGEIKAGDYDKFISLVKSMGGEASMVLLRTSGGDFFESIKIGRALRALKLGCNVAYSENGHPDCEGVLIGKDEHLNDPNDCTCMSSCFFIYVGAVFRNGNYIGVHRPYFEKSLFAGLSEKQAEIKYKRLMKLTSSYLDEMGVPADIQSSLMETSSDNILMLDPNQVKTHFWGYIPSIAEWLSAKCPKSLDDENKLQELREKTDKTEAEMVEKKDLEKKEKIVSDCFIKADEEMRKEAYVNFFNKKGNYEKQFLASADSGQQYNIGLKYEYGDGEKKDLKKALYWIQKAADQGYPDAEFDLGEMYLNGLYDLKGNFEKIEGKEFQRDYKQATYWLLKCYGNCEDPLKKSNLGNDLFNLASDYKEGEFEKYYQVQIKIDKDIPQAVELFEKAAELGNPDAQLALGDMYSEGKEIPQNNNLALQLYLKVANQKNDPWLTKGFAELNLGRFYEYGIGVEKDINQAIEWYKKAKEDGDGTVLGLANDKLKLLSKAP